MANLTLPFAAQENNNSTLFLVKSTGGGIGLSGGGYGIDPQGGDPGIGVAGDSDVGQGVVGTSKSNIGVSGESQSGTGVWANSNTGVGLHATSNGNVAIQAISTAQNFDAILAKSSSSAHAAVSAYNGNGGYGLWAASDGPAFGPPAVGIGIYARGHTYAAVFDGPVQCNGDHHCTGTLTAKVDVVVGSDCAEDFDVSRSEEVEPGTVMVLAENGALEQSQNAYDKKVAGVISGGGDYEPGLILGRCRSSEGRMPLALVGKVYCKADAHYGPIEVGDLLTTSPTLGHAMRAADPLKAFGAVIGKALRSLSSGQGLIPILIALQ